MIDFHVHPGNLYRYNYPDKIGLSVHQLIERMNREGIEMSVLLPLESPEGASGYFLDVSTRTRKNYVLSIPVSEKIAGRRHSNKGLRHSMLPHAG